MLKGGKSITTMRDRRIAGPIWRPIGNRGDAKLRRAILANRVLDNDLV